MPKRRKTPRIVLNSIDRRGTTPEDDLVPMVPEEFLDDDTEDKGSCFIYCQSFKICYRIDLLWFLKT